ncbi:MAG TPA: NHLP leader peptide family RiPP precursor [Thermoanaerobaculia bacterium]|jgi:hypothetical protein|nr:NHLP leader peptide family RiPP precursor [Thermoanaerobaculia bacterium]
MSTYGKEQKEYAKVIVKAWMDDAFRARLIANPRQVLEGEGFEIPAGIAITITTNSSPSSIALFLPPRPEGVADDKLIDRVGEEWHFCHC